MKLTAREPTPGIYHDRCGTPYLATKHPKTGWWLLKQGSNLLGSTGSIAYPKPDFPAAVLAGTFHLHREIQ